MEVNIDWTEAGYSDRKFSFEYDEHNSVIRYIAFERDRKQETKFIYDSNGLLIEKINGGASKYKYVYEYY